MLVGAVLANRGCAAWRVFSTFAPIRRKTLTDKDTIVLADFDNKTGDAVFDDTLKQGLSIQLEQSPFLDLISERKVNRDTEADGPFRRRPADAGGYTRGLPAHGQQGHADRLDCRPGQPVRDWPEGGELQHGRRAGGGAGAGGGQGSGAQGSGRCGGQLARASWASRSARCRNTPRRWRKRPRHRWRR